MPPTLCLTPTPPSYVMGLICSPSPRRNVLKSSMPLIGNPRNRITPCFVRISLYVDLKHTWAAVVVTLSFNAMMVLADLECNLKRLGTPIIGSKVTFLGPFLGVPSHLDYT